MNIHVIIGTEEPQRLAFNERPTAGEGVILPDGRTVVINQLVHDLVLGKLRANCSLPVVANQQQHKNR